MVSLEHYLFLATVVFSCGVYAVIFRKNIIFMMMGLELMLNAVNIVFVAASNHFNNLDGQVMAFFIIAIAVCEAAVGLAMVVTLYKKYGTINTEFLRVLRG